MTSLIKNLLLKLLLAITLVFQPVVLSYAMASMDHAHQQVVASMDHHVMGEMSDHHASFDGSNNMLDDCCSSATCCPAAMVVANELARSIPRVQFTRDYISSWPVVDLPAEIRPPRL